MKTILLVGTGLMAVEYAKVLQSMNLNFKVIGRGAKSASLFEDLTGIKPERGGLERYLEKNKLNKNTQVIIATGIETLMPLILQLVETDVERILVEKPAALDINELVENEQSFGHLSESIYVAYNRRFYASVIEAEKLIAEDGGLKSMHFEFTEWAHTIESLKKRIEVKRNWFFANSSHVVDLAFFLAGKPSELNAYSKSGGLAWHNKTNFVGAGETEKGVLFSYIANWESAGRWGIELLTHHRRIFLRPMERILVQQKGSIEIVEHGFDFTLDSKFKPGLYRQIEAFVHGNNENRLISIKEQIFNSKFIYSSILD